MFTFEQVAARAGAQQDPRIVECKQMFAPALAELRQLQREYRERQSKWMGRLATLQARWQLALERRYPADVNLVTRFESLGGGRGPSLGLILSTEQMIASWIQSIETFGPNELPHRNTWICWPQAPQKVRANFGAIEELLADLERTLADGGPVYQWIEQHGAAGGRPLPVPEPQRQARGPKVETSFEL